MPSQPLPQEILACMLTGRGMGYFCDYTGPEDADQLDARGIQPPRGASEEQAKAWEEAEPKSLAAFFRIFRPQGAPPPEAHPRDLISFLSDRHLDIAPFAPHFRPHRIPNYRPGPGETLCKVQAICLCFSDCKIIHQGGSHVRLFDRDLAAEPNIPGHEACLQVVALGEDTEARHGVHLGERYAIQADIYVDGVSHAYGYYHRGAMQQYTCLPEEVLANDRGNCLIPIDAARLEVAQAAKADLGRAEAGLAEPWGCVAARIDYRKGPKPGGVAWVLHPHADDLSLLQPLAEAARRLVLTGQHAPQLADRLGAEVLDDPADAPRVAEEGVDDILVRQPDADLVEQAAEAMAPGAVMLLPPFPEGTEAALDVGAIHYRGLYFIAHTEPTLAASYAKARRTRLKPGGRAMFVGAGGPMGQIWLQTALDSPQPPSWMLVTEIDDARLRHLESVFRPQAEAKGLEAHFANPQQTPLAELVAERSVDDVVGLCPVWEPIRQTQPFLAPEGVINVFAGIKAGTKGPVDLGMLTQRGVTIIGNSGSAVEDLTGVVLGALRGELRPNTSVALIGSLDHAWEAMRRVMYRETSGKICLFPELDLPQLIPLDRLDRFFPEVAAKLDPQGHWTREAEEELFRTCPRTRLR
ncbi:MAG: alcohol dehydrogenase catalytic domain-containing protein [Candidatus Brocadiia bacterium]